MKKVNLKPGAIHSQPLLNDFNDTLNENFTSLENPIPGDQNALYFNTSPDPIVLEEGVLQWNPTDGTLNLGMMGGLTSQQIGQELPLLAYNDTGVSIPEGTPVYISGRQGHLPKIAPAQSNSSQTSSIFGVTTTTFGTSGSSKKGLVTIIGYVRQIKTNYSGAGNWGTTWATNDKLYVSKTIAGQLTNVEPTAPHHSDVVATVAIVGAAGIGSIFVLNQKHTTLEELTDVDGTALTTDGQIPNWDNTQKYFDFDKNINDYVPYTGATADLNLGAHGIIVTDDFTITLPVKKTIVLSEPTYRDEYPQFLIPAGGQAAPDEVDHTIGGVQRRMRGFDGNATEERLSGSFEIAHDYMYGEDIEVHVHWRPSTTGLGTVIWYFDWEYSPPQGAPISQVTLSVTATLDTNKQYWHLLTSLGTLPQPSTPFRLGGKIGFNIRRSPTTDSYGADVLLEQVALHIPCDTNGSREIYIK